MLEIKNVSKVYKTGEFTQRALDNVSIQFRDNEFVSILGPSGSGKTTLLNIVGGLDQYSEGDLIINGTSTKKYQDRDWDSYRNHQIGFVFQSYNLIEHQSVISNVELALALSGISKSERRQRALNVLERVGLIDHINKRPNQLSGGQMQRVAIARALVNNPEILLADEPTGALDSETSVQILNLLKEIAQEKLVIMVTHNAELAKTYSTRIVELKDGQVIHDSHPIIETINHDHNPQGKTRMSLRTALGLSLNNLLTKKTRTILTAFAGSIGIIGIALILSLSNGVQLYINNVERDTLASYPLSIMESSFDPTEFVFAISEPDDIEDPDPNKIYTQSMTQEFLQLMSEKSTINNLSAFKSYIEENQTTFDQYTQGIQYSYPLNLNIYRETEDGQFLQVEPNNLMDDITTETSPGGFSLKMMLSNSVFGELIDDQDELAKQYDVVTGKWPQYEHEVVLLVDENNQISDYTLYSIGLLDRQDLIDNYERIQKNLPLDEIDQPIFQAEDLLDTEFKIVLNTDFYEQVSDTWIDRSDDSEYMAPIIEEARSLKIVGIMKAKPGLISTASTNMIGYTSALTKSIIAAVEDEPIVVQQLENPDMNVITGLPFPNEEDAQFSMEDLSEEQRIALAQMSPEELTEVMLTYQENASMTYESNLETLGVIDLDKPNMIQLYPSDFEAKDTLTEMINDYNQIQIDANKQENVITYSDLIKTMMSSVTSIINIISYILIAFVAVSLIVSSIMIGIITYISVLERTKEIGILRAIGASKKDISRVFNAETLIIGLFSGLLGVTVTILLLFPINNVIQSLTDVSDLAALPYQGALILIVISVALTLVSGLIPASMASKKDPVEALRSE